MQDFYEDNHRMLLNKMRIIFLKSTIKRKRLCELAEICGMDGDLPRKSYF